MEEEQRSFLTHGDKVNLFDVQENNTVAVFNKIFSGSRIYNADSEDRVEIKELINEGDYCLRRVTVNGKNRTHHFNKSRILDKGRNYIILYKRGRYHGEYKSIKHYSTLYQVNKRVAEVMLETGTEHKGMVIKKVAIDESAGNI